MKAYSLLVNLRKGMQSSSEQPLVGEERYVTTLITAAKETIITQPHWQFQCPSCLVSNPKWRLRDNSAGRAMHPAFGKGLR